MCELVDVEGRCCFRDCMCLQVFVAVAAVAVIGLSTGACWGPCVASSGGRRCDKALRYVAWLLCPVWAHGHVDVATGVLWAGGMGSWAPGQGGEEG